MPEMTQELYWLLLATIMTGLFWIVYIPNRIAVRGLWRAIGTPRDDDKPHSPWAERAIKAHRNAVENLVVFGILVLMAHILDVHSETTVLAAIVYFWARLAHFFVFTISIYGGRTLTFFIGFLCQAAYALELLGAL